MGKRGPVPMPTEIKRLRGNPGHRPLSDREPKPRRTSPRCPSWLCDEAKTKWRQIAPELLAMGVLTAADSDALSAYVTTWVQWRECCKALRLGSNDSAEMKRLHVASRNFLTILLHYQQEFGMTPSARTRIEIEPSSPESEEFARFLASKPGGQTE